MKHHHSVKIASLTGLVCAFASMVCQPAEAQNVTGYLLKQKMEYYGQIAIRSTPNGSIVDAKELQCYLLPSSTALIYNRANRKYCELPHEIWMDKFTSDGKLTGVQKGGTGTCANHKVTQYWADVYKPRATRKSFRLEFWSTNDMILPQQVVDDYLTLVGLPKGYGMPLRIIRHYDDNYKDPRHRAEIFLLTYEATPTSVPKAALSPPSKGYTKVKDEMQVILGDSDSDVMDVLRK